MGLPRWLSSKEYVCQWSRHKRHSFSPWVGKIHPLEKEMAAHSSIPVWKIPWAEEPGRLQSVESQRIRHDWAHECTKIHRIVHFKIVWILSQFKIEKKEEEEKERSGKFSLITIRTQVETGLVWVNGSQMGMWTAPSPPRRWAALSRSAGGILAFSILMAQDVTSGDLGNVQVLEDAVAGALVQVFRKCGKMPMKTAAWVGCCWAVLMPSRRMSNWGLSTWSLCDSEQKGLYLWQRKDRPRQDEG